MPSVARGARRAIAKSAESVALDQAARKFAQLEEQLDAQRDVLHAAIVAAVRSGMSKSEVGRRSGYTREYVSDLVNKANERDGGSTPVDDAGD